MKLAETAGAFRFGSSDGFLLRSNVWFVKEFTTTMSFVRATTDGTGVGFLLILIITSQQRLSNCHTYSFFDPLDVAGPCTATPACLLKYPGTVVVLRPRARNVNQIRQRGREPSVVENIGCNVTS